MIPMKSRGGFTVYRRDPRPFGHKRYVVARDGDNTIIEEFSRYAKAIRWIRSQTATPVHA